MADWSEAGTMCGPHPGEQEPEAACGRGLCLGLGDGPAQLLRNGHHPKLSGSVEVVGLRGQEMATQSVQIFGCQIKAVLRDAVHGRVYRQGYLPGSEPTDTNSQERDGGIDRPILKAAQRRGCQDTLSRRSLRHAIEPAD